MTTLAAGSAPMSTSYMERERALLSTPRLLVALPCGSTSTNNTRLPASAR